VRSTQIARSRLLLAALLFAAGCNGDGLTDTEREAAGAYLLVGINEQGLPFSIGRPCGERAERGYLELGEENRFYVELDVYNPSCPDEADDDPHTWTGTGIWTVIDGNVRLVSDLGAQQYVKFTTAPALLVGGNLTATGTLEVVGYEGDPIRPTLRPVQVTLTFTR
jgi:hypothetical protein